MPDVQEGDDEISGDGRPSVIRHWLSRFADPIVLVALIAALASATFAYQTNAISKRQVELLNRQVSIEESLALPVFSVSLDVGEQSEAGAASHWITIENHGGLANDLVIDVLPFLSFWWSQDDGTGQPVMMQGDELPLVGYFNEYSHTLPSRMNPGARTSLGFDGNAAAFRHIAGRLTGELAAQDAVTELDHALEVMISLSYIDYMGVERVDYYIGQVTSTGEVFPPQQFMRVNATSGEEIQQDYYDKFDGRFMLVLDPESELPDDGLVQTLGARIYSQRFTDIDESATPSTSVPDAFRDRRIHRSHVIGTVETLA